MKNKNRIRFFRRQADLTQTELGKAVGVGFVKIHRWEKGYIRCPEEMRAKIASSLGLPLATIFPGSEV